MLKLKKAFTLIELLVVITIIGILSAALLIAINPTKRSKQARDAIRKNDIAQIANALITFYTLTNGYPAEGGCDSSIGLSPNYWCPPTPPLLLNNWRKDSLSARYIYNSLVTDESLLKKLPVDPINNTSYFYRYEPSLWNEPSPGIDVNYGPYTNYYWIGAMLEDPSNPSQPVFRCSDITTLPDGAGCKEVSGDIYGSLTIH